MVYFCWFFGLVLIQQSQQHLVNLVDFELTPIYISFEFLIDFDFSPMSPLPLSTPRHFPSLSGWGGGTICPLNSCPHANMNQDCLEIKLISAHPRKGNFLLFDLIPPFLPFSAKKKRFCKVVFFILLVTNKLHHIPLSGILAVQCPNSQCPRHLYRTQCLSLGLFDWHHYLE